MANILELFKKESGFIGKVWTLKNNDTGEVLRGQYVPQDYTENVGAKIPEVSTVNNQEPFPQWVGGEGETSTFKARIFQITSEDSVTDQVERLKAATQKDESRFRAPIFTFTWGVDISYKCFVVSLGGIKYDEINNVGEIKGAEFTIVLRKIANEPKQGLGKLQSLSGLVDDVKNFFSSIGGNGSDIVDVINASPHTISRRAIAKEGDTFESIAQREYGNALVGDILRRAQPEKLTLQAGDEVILIDRTEIFEIEVTPVSNPLKRTATSKAVRDVIFEKRNRKRVKVF